MNRFKIISFFFFALLSCGDGAKPEVSFGNTSFEKNQYSDAELIVLRKAEGRSIPVLTSKKIEELLDEKRLTVFHLNDISNPEFFIIFEKIASKFDTQFQPVHLILETEQNRDAVNLFIRKNNLASEAFILSDKELLKSEMSDWSGRVPAIWIKNRIEEIDLIYEQDLTEDELLAILQPVTL